MMIKNSVRSKLSNVRKAAKIEIRKLVWGAMVLEGFHPSPRPEVCRDAAEAGWDSCRSGTQPITEL
jgi:hypothetical protein